MKRSIAVLSLLAFGGCTPDVDSGTDSRVAVEGEGPLVHIALDGPGFSVGGLEGRAGQTLSRVVFAGLAEDNVLAVAELDGRIQWFNRKGQVIQSAGRHGEGPGEFSSIRSAAFGADDSLYVYDAALRRLTVYDSDGELTRTQDVSGLGQNQWNLELAPSQGRCCILVEVVRSPQQGLEDSVDSLSVLVAYPNDEASRPLATAPYVESRTIRDERGSWTGPVPQSPRSAVFAAGNEVRIYDGFREAISTFDLSGNMIGVMDPPRVEKLLAPDRDELRRRLIARIPDPERRRMALAHFDVGLSSAGPSMYDKAMASEDGHMWLRRYHSTEAEYQLWIRSNSSGDITDALAIPADAVVMGIGAGAVSLLVRDSLDVEAVLVREFENSE